MLNTFDGAYFFISGEEDFLWTAVNIVVPSYPLTPGFVEYVDVYRNGQMKSAIMLLRIKTMRAMGSVQVRLAAEEALRVDLINFHLHPRSLIQFCKNQRHP
jgi:hypothetical protein